MHDVANPLPLNNIELIDMRSKPVKKPTAKVPIIIKYSCLRRINMSMSKYVIANRPY